MEKNNIKLTDIKHSTTNHMTIEDWVKSVEDGMFVDYDAYFAPLFFSKAT